MKVKNLVATGCSFIEGGCLAKTHNPELDNSLDIKQQELLRFSNQLALKLNCKEYNLASAGGSNHLAIRRTYDWINENEDKVENTLFVMGLTEVFRKEKYSRETQEYIKWRSTLFFSGENKIENWQKLVLDSHKFKKYVEDNNVYDDLLNYAKVDIELFTDLDYEFKYLNQQLDMLNAYIESKGGKLIVFGAMLELDEGRVQNQFNIKGTLNTKNLNFYTFPGGYNCWKSYIITYNKYFTISDHPNANDDSILSELIFEYSKSIL